MKSAGQPPRSLIVAACLTLLLVIGGIATADLTRLLNQQKVERTALAELNHVRHGLLSGSAWVEQVAPILSRQIDGMLSNPGSREGLREQLNRFLKATVADELDKARRGDYGMVQGMARQLCLSAFLNEIPKISDAILTWLSDPDAQRNVEGALHTLLAEAITGHDADWIPTEIVAIQSRWHCADVAACQTKLAASIQDDNAKVQLRFALCIAAFVLLLLLAHYLAVGSSYGLLLIGLSSLTLLIGGVLTPMIDVEASIAQLSFELAAEQIEFNNQLLYFQSKSIMDVIALLVRSGKVDLIFVGFLVGLFSVIFPAAKLVSSLVYFNLRRLRTNPVVAFFALKSGKWSMADVFVVALFMAYIGFEGILSNQLQTLQGSSEMLHLFTQNGTALRPGFYLFLGFCLSSLYLSSRLESAVHQVE